MVKNRFLVKRIPLAILLLSILSCNPRGFDETIDQTFVASPRDLVVPDSSNPNNILVRIVAYLGPTTAFSLDRITTSLTDTLFSLAVIARHKEKTGDAIKDMDIILDSTMVLKLSPARYIKHYFKLFDSQGGFLLDSTLIVP
jgi:hypothetical protein